MEFTKIQDPLMPPRSRGTPNFGDPPGSHAPLQLETGTWTLRVSKVAPLILGFLPAGS